MADYYRILSAAIENQDLSSESDRQALYVRAKTALEAQFSSMDQDLVADLIKSHEQDFDDAVAKIEQELQAAAERPLPSGEGSDADTTPIETAEPASASSTPESSSPPLSSPAFLPESKVGTTVEPNSPDGADTDSGPETAPTLKADSSDAPPAKQDPVGVPTGAPSSAASQETSPPPSAAPKTADVKLSAPSAYVAPPTRVEPPMKTSPAGTPTPRQPLSGSLEPENKKRRGGAIFFAVLLLLIVAVSAFGLWQQDLVRDYSDRLGVMTGLWAPSDTLTATGDNQAVSVNDPPRQNTMTNDSGTSAPMDAVSQAPSTQSPVIQSPESETAPTPATNNSRAGDSAPVRNEPATQQVASNEPESPTAVQDQSAEPNAATGAPQTNPDAAPSDTQAAQTSGANQQQAAGQEPAATSPIELPLRAFFLIEKTTGGADPDDRYSGGALWKFDPATNILHIDTFFPRRKAELNIEIQANTDTSFPASHTVSYQHVSLDEKPDGPIVNFPALMVRADAGSEGEPLKGAGALIVPDKYILGLSENPENVSHNLNLLNKAQWLVVPVVFEIDNRRALFVIEKGPQGAREFASALAAWGQTDLLTE